MNPDRLIPMFVELVRAALLEAEPSAAGNPPVIETIRDFGEDPRSWYRMNFDSLPRFELLVAVDASLNLMEEDDPAQLSGIVTAFTSALAKRIGERFALQLPPPGLSAAAPPEDPLAAVIRVGFADGKREFLVGVPEAALIRLGGESKKRSTVMDVLLDVQLPVNIVLGVKEIPLGDVLRLGAGSVIEFENRLGDPVDVIVNKRVVARGEVIAVSGSYGVRVAEVLGDGSESVLV